MLSASMMTVNPIKTSSDFSIRVLPFEEVTTSGTPQAMQEP
jgi:hypothetical protein